MIVVRPYTVKDSIKLSHIINEVCASSLWMSTRSFVPTNAWLHAMEADDCYRHQLLIAEKNGDIIGWCRSFPVDCKAPSFHAEFGIGLLPNCQNQGIGSELIKQSMLWSRAVGLLTLVLTVASQNSIAVHLFKKCGFVPVGTDGTNILMSAFLS